jgi:ketosteroid isomerase-like protein
MKTKKCLYATIASLSLILVPIYVISQTKRNSPTDKVVQRTTAAQSVEDAIRKELQDMYAAADRHDAAALLAHFADGEGMYYAPEFGRMDTERYKAAFREAIELSVKLNEKVVDEITKLYVLPLRPDTALANYVLVNKTTVDGKTETIRFGETDIFVLRNGRWLVSASHSNVLPKDVEPVIAGLPTDWERSPAGTGNSYSMTVDTAVRHEGKASASLRFACGSEGIPWGSLSQQIDAAEYKGKRVRLYGWIKTADVVYVASIWMRAEGERHMLAYGDMQDRPVKGTTDWKRYEVVLHIPDNAINLKFGAFLQGKGQAWFDDFALEIVGPDTPVTDKLSDVEKKSDRESLANLKRSLRTAPVNLGFENGIVK